jgi:hypothetical protein
MGCSDSRGFQRGPSEVSRDDDLAMTTRGGVQVRADVGRLVTPGGAPKRVVFGELPHTSTGKVQKYILRERQYVFLGEGTSSAVPREPAKGDGRCRPRVTGPEKPTKGPLKWRI